MPNQLAFQRHINYYKFTNLNICLTSRCLVSKSVDLFREDELFPIIGAEDWTNVKEEWLFSSVSLSFSCTSSCYSFAALESFIETHLEILKIMEVLNRIFRNITSRWEISKSHGFSAALQSKQWRKLSLLNIRSRPINSRAIILFCRVKEVELVKTFTMNQKKELMFEGHTKKNRISRIQSQCYYFDPLWEKNPSYSRS
jgi:hypothetical protein